MSILPAFVLNLITAHLDAVLNWCSERLYQQLLAQIPDEFLVRLHAHLDCASLAGACQAYHHQSGPGAKPTHEVPKLVRALLVKYLCGWSLRTLEFQVRFNLVVKWFVGYSVFAIGPDYSTLDRFEQWVCAHQHRAFFDETLKQIDAAFPDERRQAQIGDTFALQANAAKEDLVQLLRHSGQRLLCSLAEVAPALQVAVETRLADSALFGARPEPSWHRLSEHERAARLQTTALATIACADWVRAALDNLMGLAPEAREAVRLWLRLLDKILADELDITRDADGRITQVRELAKEEKGSYRLGSATDPDATYRIHGKDKTDFGYNVQIAVTENFVREIQADTGAQPDPVSIPDVLAAQRAYHDLLPPKLIYDTAAGQGKTRALVAAATDQQTPIVAPLFPHDKPNGTFAPEQFTLSDDGTTVTCPHDQSTTIAYRSGSSEGRTFRFLPGQCQDCPLWIACRGEKAKPLTMRQVFISDYRTPLDAARAYNQTDAFKADMKKRPAVERIIAALVRYNGARRARGRGQLKADFQMKMSATAYNLKKWMRLNTPTEAAVALAVA